MLRKYPRIPSEYMRTTDAPATPNSQCACKGEQIELIFSYNMERMEVAKPLKRPIHQALPRVGRRRTSVPAEPVNANQLREASFVVVTGMSGSGKASVLKVFEDLGYFCVDNLPVDLILKFAELCRTSGDIRRAALVVDIREGEALRRFPEIYRQFRSQVPSILVFLQASDEVVARRFSETRRPHPLGSGLPLREGIEAERKKLRTIQKLADLVIDTSHFTVHDLKQYISKRFGTSPDEHSMLISCVSFGYRFGVPTDSDLVFDVRFLPNPNYIPRFKNLTGKHKAVARYIASFPQTQEFTRRITDLLAYLIPHYIREGKSYLTISFGCTGGRHRSVMIAETIFKNLGSRGFLTKVYHRDVGK